jgi:hypothetical protein
MDRASSARRHRSAQILQRSSAGVLAARSVGMASRLIRCPETAYLERIDYQIDPLGILIDACTRECPLECARTCAAQLDCDRRCSLEDATKIEVPLGRRIIEVRSLLRGRD